MNSSNTTFSKLYNDGKSQAVRLRVDWEEDQFKLSLVEGKNAWFALVTKQMLAKLAEQHELPFATYLESLRHHMCNSSSSITTSINSKNGEFILYRHIEQETIKLKYFVIKLEKLNYNEYIEDLLDTLTIKCQEMSSLLSAKDCEKLAVEEEKNALQHKCEELAEIKNKSDLQIYSAVALLLNEKKNRIQFLTEVLESTGDHTFINNSKPSAVSSLKTHNTTITYETKPSTSKRVILSNSDPDSSDGYDTDKDAQMDEKNCMDLDFLGDESPPPLLLPKRIKTDTFSFKSKAIENETRPFESVEVLTKSADDNDDNQTQASNYNTQEFLDMM